MSDEATRSPKSKPPLERVWQSLWPKLIAIAIAVLGWQAVVSLGDWPPWVLPGPSEVLPRLVKELSSRLADMVPRFLPPKAREQGDRPVNLRVARINHDNSAASDVETLKEALVANLQPIAY